MSYQLSKSQKEIQKAARDFAKGEFDKDLAYELDKNQEFPEKIWKKAADLGFIGMHFPEAYSGGELDMLDNVLLAEEFCRKDSTIGCALMLSGFASECVLRFGSNELKDEPLLPDSLRNVFFKLIKAGFLHKRKTLRNSLSKGLGWAPDQVEILLDSANINPQRRAETLSMDEWIDVVRRHDKIKSR